jgi:hypothetical protein
MEQEFLPREASVDAKTAEEALSLALRLQQERGDRVPVAELHRVAEEAGIDPECLSDALRQLEDKKKADSLKVEQSHVVSRERSRNVLSAAFVAIVVVIVASTPHGHGAYAYAPIGAALMAALFGARVRRLRRCGRLNQFRAPQDPWV